MDSMLERMIRSGVIDRADLREAELAGLSIPFYVIEAEGINPYGNHAKISVQYPSKPSVLNEREIQSAMAELLGDGASVNLEVVAVYDPYDWQGPVPRRNPSNESGTI